MPTVSLRTYVDARSSTADDIRNPLPKILQTPSGLAILELQGTINVPSHSAPSLPDDAVNATTATPVGSLVFPDYDPDNPTFNKDDMSWMKRVHLYVGKHQRLTGEIKKLTKPLAVIGGRETSAKTAEELEIREVVYWKILFSSRPEPVSG